MMSYGFLLNSVPIDCKNLLRKIETEEKRMIRIRSLQQFTKNCLDNTILPKYVNIKHRDQAVSKSLNNPMIHHSMMKEEMTTYECNINQTSDKIKKFRSLVEEKFLEYKVDISTIHRIYEHLDQILQVAQHSASVKLAKKINHNNSQAHFEKFDDMQKLSHYINLSNHILTSDEEDFN